MGTKLKLYTRREMGDELFEVIGPDGNVILNHSGKTYPPLSENISRNLIGDLNHIAERYDDKKAPETKEEVYGNIIDRLSGIDLHQSFSYCLISSLMEYEEQQMDAQLDVDSQIQWDRLFRMNAPENGGELELNSTKKARVVFEGKWKNFGLNYAQSIEDMEENGAEMVSEDIVTEITGMVVSLHISKIVAVDILYNFFDHFSITIPILWVSGKINDEDFISSYYALNYGIAIDDLDEEAYEEPRFLMNRLLHLKTIIWGYQWKDQSLPCVNY